MSTTIVPDTAPITCPPSAWKRLLAVTGARGTATTRLNELISLRKELDETLNELGAGASKQHLQTSRQYVVVIREIDYQRARIKTLADHLEKTVNGAVQGKVFDDEETERICEGRQPDEEMLFHSDDDDEEDEGEKDDPDQQRMEFAGGAAAPAKPAVPPTPPTPDTRPVGVPPAKAEPSVVDGLSIHSLAKHGVADRAIQALVRAEFLTVGALTGRRMGHNGAPGRLTLISGITAADERDIERAIERLHEQDRTLRSGWTFPGRFSLSPVGGKRKPVEVVAGDMDSLEGQITKAVGGSYDLFDAATGEVLVNGDCILTVAMVGAAAAVQPGEAVDGDTGEIKREPASKGKGGRKRKA